MHANAIDDDVPRTLSKDEAVEYSTRIGRKGHQAVSVRPVGHLRASQAVRQLALEVSAELLRASPGSMTVGANGPPTGWALWSGRHHNWMRMAGGPDVREFDVAIALGSDGRLLKLITERSFGTQGWGEPRVEELTVASDQELSWPDHTWEPGDGEYWAPDDLKRKFWSPRRREVPNGATLTRQLGRVWRGRAGQRPAGVHTG